MRTVSKGIRTFIFAATSSGKRIEIGENRSFLKVLSWLSISVPSTVGRGHVGDGAAFVKERAVCNCAERLCRAMYVLLAEGMEDSSAGP